VVTCSKMEGMASLV